MLETTRLSPEDFMNSRRTWMIVLASGLPLLLFLGDWALSQDKASGPALTSLDKRDFGKAVLLRSGVRRSPVVNVVERVREAVVNIHSERTLQGSVPAEFFSLSPSQNRINGMGTGIVIDPRGYIVTNHHVVEDVSVIRIRLSDGTTQSALVVARSPDTDLALLKIDVGRSLPTMPLGTAADLMVGETVIAIGNAYGYEHTVSVGVVSATKRDVSLNKEMSYKALIQTDASINPGNSGGPLLNVNGELVGVNVAIRAGAQGIGFAIPVDSVIRVVAEMLKSRRRASNYDGLVYHDQLESCEEGVLRRVVLDQSENNSPATGAGIKKGDVIVQVGDVPVKCSFDVERGLMDRRSGEPVSIIVRREGKEQTVELALSSPPSRARPGAVELIWAKLGVQLRSINAELVSRVNRQLHGGLEVTVVDAEGTAARAGIKRGDILVGLHNWEILNLENVAYVLGHPDLPTFNPLSFYIVRNGQVRRGWISSVN